MILASGVVLLTVNYLLVRGRLPQIATGSSDTPSGSPGASSGGVQGAALRDYRAEVLETLLQQSLIALCVLVVVAALFGWLAAQRMLRPVQAVVATARRLSADNLQQRIRMPGRRDELTDLADTFDEMLDRLAASFDSQRRFVANASHELRTPLAAQRTLIEVAMERTPGGDDKRHPWGRLLAMNERIEAIIEGLLTLARSDRGLQRRERVRLDEVAETALAAHETAVRQGGFAMHSVLEPRVVLGDKVLLERMVGNLVQNAIKHNHSGGSVWLRVGREPAIEISNTGPDVPSESTAELFEPFRQLHRVNGAHPGAGLGLSIVASVARAHGGSASAQARAGGGLVVRVELPVSVSD
ncbi:sensor histidine kinase [Allorhizocola rhizosphaerae]|uniref:sensor histidine kinase n=1 Tax=Allorhizocola rhizosphaerae TaxID=1872709 RepID=UPI001B8C321C|nr:HAMP domain-containing sensor histidine kinase [Allorhizocola rhizosphaerae]